MTEALAVDGIPYRWEQDVILVVPEVAEDEVDLLLDHLEALDSEPSLDPTRPTAARRPMPPWASSSSPPTACGTHPSTRR